MDKLEQICKKCSELGGWKLI